MCVRFYNESCSGLARKRTCLQTTHDYLQQHAAVYAPVGLSIMFTDIDDALRKNPLRIIPISLEQRFKRFARVDADY